MKKQRLSVEVVHKIWDDDMGTNIEVGEDKDGLGMIEVRFFEDKLEPFNSVMFTVGEAELAAKSLLYFVEEMRKKYPECEASEM
jgi:hypothetical protein